MVRLFQQHVPKRKLLLILSEGFLLTAVVFFGTSLPGLATRPLAQATPDQWVKGLLSALTVAVLAQVSLSYNDLYDWRVSQNRQDLPNRLLHAAGFAFIILAILVFLFPRLFFFPGIPDLRGQTWRFVVVLAAGFVLIYFWRIGFHWFFYKWGFGERVIVLGTGRQAIELARDIRDRPETGFEIVGLIGRRPPPRRDGEPPVPYLGPPERLPELADEHRISRVVVSLADRRGALPVDALLACRLAGIRVEEREAIYERIHGKLCLEGLRPSYLIFSPGFHSTRLQAGLKRLMDVVLSLLGLVLTAPLSVLIAVAIKLDSPGPVLYRQRRIGRDGREFVLLKFRTMRHDAEKATGPVWARRGDDRVTRIGRILRRTRLDEIPQMWNILVGEMSFVGPRPERPFFVERLRREIPYYLERLTVRPGLTGWAQVNFPYGASIEDAKQKLMYDLYYIKNMSLVFDLTIMLRTIKVLLLRRGAH